MCGSPSNNSRWACNFTMPPNDVSIVFHLPTSMSSFSAPVDASPTVNRAQAGRVIPFKFSVTSQGQPVTGLTSSDVSVTPLLAGCESGAPVDGVEIYASRPGLVDLGDGSYVLNYQTSKSWAGTCGSLTVATTGGGSQAAQFSFK
jgi:hypothetical protein